MCNGSVNSFYVHYTHLLSPGLFLSVEFWNGARALSANCHRRGVRSPEAVCLWTQEVYSVSLRVSNKHGVLLLSHVPTRYDAKSRH